MRSLILFTLLSAGVLFSGPAVAQGISFENLTMSQAMAKASDPSAPKLIFMDCYTSWCMPCLEMAKEVFPKKECGDFFNPRFVSVKFDMEKGEGAALRKKYDVNVYPTFLILDSKGEEINRVVGKAGAAEFIEKVKAAMDPNTSMAGMKATYENKKSMMNGYPYAKALFDNGRDPSSILEELYDSSNDFERFSFTYLDLALRAVKFGSPFFRKMMLEKARIDQAVGAEMVNQIIFDKIRKDMYFIATETGGKYNIHYTPEEVENVAYTMALLKQDPQKPESHMCRIALYVARKDLDGMIDYYKRYMWNLSPTESFKAITDGIISSKAAGATEAQKESIREYFRMASRSFEREAKQYQIKSENIK